jgi:hypothetical protein
MTRRYAFLGAAVAIALLASGRAEATTAAALSNQQMTQDAALIATGRCVELKSVWEGRNLVTLATIALNDVLKGEAGETVTVALPGGADANRKFPVAMTYPGAPQIAVQEEVFLFLGRDDDAAGPLHVLGFSQGKFSIVPDDQGGKVVSRNLSEITLTGPAGSRRGTATRVPFDQFKEEVRSYLRSTAQ